MKPFPKLVYCGFMDNDIKILEIDLFDFNPDLQLVSFWNNKIIIIGAAVFDKLPKLTWLYLDLNRCINMRSESIVSLTKYIIRHVKYKCIDPETITSDKTIDFDQDFENLEMVQAAINELKENITSINEHIANIEETNVQLKEKMEEFSNHNGSYLWIVIVIFIALLAAGGFIAYKRLNIYR
ncbi:unnamed protein product [Chironomus riparius]|uniref:Uncharacterized protein n=1 Tax=Chironomus riparius TaxID=315576 RepID=A0A9N9RY49_9DIPT|nr:unnamed protein product [Chironomus riparius]